MKKGVRAAFHRLDYAIVNTGWLLLIVFAFQLFEVPERVVGTVMLVQAYVVITVGAAADSWLIRDDRRCPTVPGPATSGGKDWQRDTTTCEARAHLPRLALSTHCGSASHRSRSSSSQGSTAWWRGGPRLIECVGLFLLGRW